MPQQKAAPTAKDERQSAKNSYEHYSKIHHKYQYSGKSKKRYPHSAYSARLAKPCQYCGNAIGLIIIRFKEDRGFCRCGRCHAALFSLNESTPKQRIAHIGAILDRYLSYGEVGK
ncbi:MAG: hypothetical protein WA959_00305 [Rivularia sp. (in: cyanobacteria)]